MCFFVIFKMRLFRHFERFREEQTTGLDSFGSNLKQEPPSMFNEQLLSPRSRKKRRLFDSDETSSLYNMCDNSTMNLPTLPTTENLVC